MNLPPLRDRPFDPGHVLVTGANGYVGTLVVASLLRDTAARVTCLVRSGHALGEMLRAVADEWQQQSGSRWSTAIESRLAWKTLPDDLSDLAQMAPALADVDEIVHAAGCLDYHHAPRLQQANLLYTAHLLLLARRLSLRRFVCISSAYASGLRDDGIEEAPLPEPSSDPTVYTRSKRHGERLVGAAGVPFVVLRPSILIGDSRSGRYTGKRYGLVQQWASLVELGALRWHAEFHAVASEQRLHLLHQDHFCAAFKSAHRWLPDGSHAHLVSDPRRAPTLRGLWQLWFEAARPARVVWHARLDDVPLRRIESRQRAYLAFARINLRIALHEWRFETGWLDRLQQVAGLQMGAATTASVRRCQQRFLATVPGAHISLPAPASVSTPSRRKIAAAMA